jgi:peptidoglycan/LPS O-acetylase OafA/YrhL
MFSVPFLLLACGGVGCELTGQLKAPKWLTKLGDWSFSLYLTHYIVLVTLRRVYRMVVPDELKVGAVGVVDNVIFALLALLISILTAAIFYNFIESPSLKLFKKLRT